MAKDQTLDMDRWTQRQELAIGLHVINCISIITKNFKFRLTTRIDNFIIIYILLY